MLSFLSKFLPKPSLNQLIPMTEATIATINSDLRQTSAQAVIRAAYRQVFGNAHLMEEERCISAESLYINGDISVQGLVTALAQSDSYRRLFLDNNGPYRFVELNFKHLLGRAPATKQKSACTCSVLPTKAMKPKLIVTHTAWNTSVPLDSIMFLTCVAI